MTQTTARDPEARYDRSLYQVLDFFFDEQIKLLHTCLPGIVVEYNSETFRARIQPALRLLLYDGSTMTKPPILDCPVKQTATGGHLVHHELQAGDVVILHFSERGLDQFKQQWGTISNPGDAVMSERDGLAVPWGSPISPVADTGWVVQNADGDTYISVQGETQTITVEAGQRVHIGGTGGQQLLTIQFGRDFNAHTHSIGSGATETGAPTQQAALTAGTDTTDKTRAE